MSDHAEQLPPALFDWPRRSVFAPYLLGFIALSALAHLATFFLFRVVYPERVSIPAPPSQVTLLAPTTPDNQALLRWIESEEPAHLASGRGSYTPEMAGSKYKASFETPRTMPRTLSQAATVTPFPPAKTPLEMIRSAVPREESVSSGENAVSTTMLFGSELRGRIDPENATFTPQTKSREPVEPAEFLIGVSGEGRVRYVFLQHSSGVRALDTEVEERVNRLVFATSETALVWERLQVRWGDDVYTEKAP
jgi:hypothetical protein